MKKRIALLILFLCTIIVVTGCSLTKSKESKAKEKNVTITYEEMQTMEKISKVIFQQEKESFKVNDMTEEQKSEIARSLAPNGYLDTSGSEMIKIFQKYFGEDQTVSFEDIKCFMKHDSEEEQTLYFFDKEKDKYVYNEKHPGHGGGGMVGVGSTIEYDSVEVKGNTYLYKTKVLFYGKVNCYDIGPCAYGKAYKSYNDAKNETNPLTEIDNNSKYVKQSIDGFPETHLELVMQDYKENLDTYTFVFEKTDNDIIFKEYKKEG